MKLTLSCYFLNLIRHSSKLYSRLLYLKFQSKLLSFHRITTISFGVHFLLWHRVLHLSVSLLEVNFNVYALHKFTFYLPRYLLTLLVLLLLISWCCVYVAAAAAAVSGQWRRDSTATRTAAAAGATQPTSLHGTARESTTRLNDVVAGDVTPGRWRRGSRDGGEGVRRQPSANLRTEFCAADITGCHCRAFW